jgi:hypothetical protein
MREARRGWEGVSSLPSAPNYIATRRLHAVVHAYSVKTKGRVVVEESHLTTGASGGIAAYMLTVLRFEFRGGNYCSGHRGVSGLERRVFWGS